MSSCKQGKDRPSIAHRPRQAMSHRPGDQEPAAHGWKSKSSKDQTHVERSASTVANVLSTLPAYLMTTAVRRAPPACSEWVSWLVRKLVRKLVGSEPGS